MAKKKIILDAEGKDTGEAEGPDESYIPWAGRQAAIGLGETPGAFATLYGMGGALKDYLSAGKDDTRGFKEHFLDPDGGKDKFDAYNENIVDRLRRKHPDAPDEEIQRRFDKVQKHSKKYFKDTSEFMRPGIAFARRWNVGVNEALGDERLPTEKTQSDQVMNIIGGAAPLPGVGGIASATGATGAKIAGKIATNRALRYGVNTVEALAPITTPPTLGRFAANVGVGTAIDQGVRTYEGNPAFIAAPVATVKDFVTEDDGSTDVKAIGAAGAVATILGGKALKNLYRVRATPPTPNAATVAGGPPQSTMQAATNPDVDLTMANRVSDVAPVKKMLKDAGGMDDDEITKVMTVYERNAGPMPVGDHKIWEDAKLTPVVEKFVREDPAFQQMFLQHRADRARVYGDSAAIQETDEALAKATKKLQTLQNATPNRQSQTLIAAQQQKIRDIQLEKQIRQADSDPNLRPSLMDESSADVAARMRQSAADPRIQQLENIAFRLHDDIVDVGVDSGMYSKYTAQQMKARIRAGNYTLSEGPLSQKGWLGTVKGMAKWTGADSQLIHSRPDVALSVFREINSPRHRKGYLDTQGKRKYVNSQAGWEPEKRVNNPRDPFSELQFMSVRTRQAAAANRLTKTYAEALFNSRGNANKRLMWDDPQTPRIHESMLTEKTISSLLQKQGKVKGAYPIMYFDGGDLVVKWHNNKTINDVLKFSPAQVIPILNATRKAFQFGTTGPGHPQWIGIGTVWDIMMGSGMRHPSMVFGPLSGALASKFGREAPITRIGSSVGAWVDAAANMARLPYAMSRGIVQELVGNQIARRWQVQLETNSGVISQIAKLPGGQQLIKGTVDAMVRGYQSSITQMTKAMKVGHLTNYNDEISGMLRQLDDLGKKRPMYKSFGNSLLSVLSVMHDVPKAMFLSQNLKLYKKELAKGRQLQSFMNEEFIANEARKIGGDLARVSGDPRVQRTLSAIPFGNVSVQSMRYLAQRLKEHPADTYTKLASLTAAMAWTYHNIAMDEEGSNWFFNELPQAQRIQSIPIPNAWRFMQRMAGLTVPRGTPQEEYTLVRMPPEMMPIFIPVMHGMMALGFIDTKHAVVPPTIAKDFGMMVDQIFGLGLPPLASAGLAASGYKIEPSKLVTGGNPVREIRDFTFSGANKDKMSPESRIPHAYHDVVNALLGTAMGTVVEAANYGDIVYGKTGDLTEGVTQGVKKFGVEQAARTPYSNHLWPEVNKRFIYTPYTEKMQEELGVMRKADAQMSAEPALRMLLGKSGGYNTNDYLQAMEGTSVAGMIQDPDVMGLLAEVHMSFFTGPFLQLQKERARARRIHESMTTGVNKDYVNNRESPLMRFKKAQEQAKEVNRLDREMYNLYSDVWKEMKTSPNGMAFEKKYGPLTPENFLSAVRKSARQGSQEAPR